MARSNKVKSILLSFSSIAIGLISLIAGEGSLLPYITGGILSFLGIIFLSESSNKYPGLVTFGIGSLFIINSLLDLGIMYFIGFLSLIGGSYFAYKTFKQLK